MRLKPVDSLPYKELKNPDTLKAVLNIIQDETPIEKGNAHDVYGAMVNLLEILTTKNGQLSEEEISTHLVLFYKAQVAGNFLCTELRLLAEHFDTYDDGVANAGEQSKVTQKRKEFGATLQELRVVWPDLPEWKDGEGEI